MRPTIPVIDIFAGPGGLGEGFCSYKPGKRRNRAYRIALSVEKDPDAHRTLELRSFYRQFSRTVPDDYYRYLRGEIERDDLFRNHPFQAAAASNEAMLAELGVDDDDIYERIGERLEDFGNRPWLLVGGPPCQAYSVVGRSKRRILSETDGRQVLYQEYLKIIARFRPAVFVMENVKGMISSTARLDENAQPNIEGKQELIFQRILRDLKRPVQAVRDAEADWNGVPDEAGEVSYRIYSLVKQCNDPEHLLPSNFVIKSEDYGVPQTRHRVILLGVRSDVADITGAPDIIKRHSDGRIPVDHVIDKLPFIRSQISKNKKNVRVDSPENWKSAIGEILQAGWLDSYVPPTRAVQLRLFDDKVHPDQPASLRCAIRKTAGEVMMNAGIGAPFIEWTPAPDYEPSWFLDERLGGICNHEARSHMESDLHRYLYLANFAGVYGLSPTMRQFPEDLVPDHKNLKDKNEDEDLAFGDRFRVQVKGQPATTITSHISKDGHYNVHYNPLQCRSLTVREAARIQTFPDNYLFEGPRTKQYEQVGNAVPPLLARQVAQVVYDLFEKLHAANRSEP